MTVTRHNLAHQRPDPHPRREEGPRRPARPDPRGDAPLGPGGLRHQAHPHRGRHPHGHHQAKHAQLHAGRGPPAAAGKQEVGPRRRSRSRLGQGRGNPARGHHSRAAAGLVAARRADPHGSCASLVRHRARWCWGLCVVGCRAAPRGGPEEHPPPAAVLEAE